MSYFLSQILQASHSNQTVPEASIYSKNFPTVPAEIHLVPDHIGTTHATVLYSASRINSRVSRKRVKGLPPPYARTCGSGPRAGESVRRTATSFNRSGWPIKERRAGPRVPSGKTLTHPPGRISRFTPARADQDVHRAAAFTVRQRQVYRWDVAMMDEEARFGVDLITT